MESRRLAASEQIARELRSRESDMQEMLSAKETQLSLLRMRLAEADRLLELEKQRVTDIQADRERSEICFVSWLVASCQIHMLG